MYTVYIFVLKLIEHVLCMSSEIPGFTLDVWGLEFYQSQKIPKATFDGHPENTENRPRFKSVQRNEIHCNSRSAPHCGQVAYVLMSIYFYTSDSTSENVPNHHCEAPSKYNNIAWVQYEIEHLWALSFLGCALSFFSVWHYPAPSPTFRGRILMLCRICSQRHGSTARRQCANAGPLVIACLWRCWLISSWSQQQTMAQNTWMILGNALQKLLFKKVFDHLWPSPWTCLLSQGLFSTNGHCEVMVTCRDYRFRVVKFLQSLKPCHHEKLWAWWERDPVSAIKTGQDAPSCMWCTWKLWFLGEPYRIWHHIL